MKHKIAFRGDSTRGKEVINILEMLGGINKWEYLGDRQLCAYYINCDGIINYTSNIKGYNLQIFTIDEFIEKYPYKIGDKVEFIKYDDEEFNVYEILYMKWTGTTIEYTLDCCGFTCLKKDIRPHIDKNVNIKKRTNMFVRIVKELYSDGSVKYALYSRNYRGGFEPVYLKDGSGCAEFDTYKEAYKYAFPNKSESDQMPYIISSEVMISDYSDLEY